MDSRRGGASPRRLLRSAKVSLTLVPVARVWPEGQEAADGVTKPKVGETGPKRVRVAGLALADLTSRKLLPQVFAILPGAGSLGDRYFGTT